MILYHCNFGFPVVSPDSELLVDDELRQPARCRGAAPGFDTRTAASIRPQPDYAEQVFFHKPRVGADGFVQGGHRQPRAGLRRLRALPRRRTALPGPVEDDGAGRLCLRAGTGQPVGTPRHRLREEGRLRYLAPREEVHYHLEIGVLPDAAAVAAFAAAVGSAPSPTD